MTAQVRAGLPALEQLTRQPLDDDQRLILRESAKPSLEGYSGWFDYGTGVIEMGEELDPAVTLHELAHRWFNDDTSYHRWITEGLAETYANAVAERAGGTAHQPGVPRRRAPGKRPLNEWESFSFAQQDERAEKYGYDTSFFVVDTLFDEIGPGRMADVLTAIDAGTPVYGAAGSGPARPGELASLPRPARTGRRLRAGDRPVPPLRRLRPRRGRARRPNECPRGVRPPRRARRRLGASCSRRRGHGGVAVRRRRRA